MTTWKHNLPDPDVSEKDVHVWLCNLTQSSSLGSFRRFLSRSESARATQFKNVEAQFMFIASRIFVRCVLGLYLKADPGSVPIEIGEDGKPRLASGSSLPNLEFNLTHTQRQTACVVTRGIPAGIDLEVILPSFQDEAVAMQVLDPSELASFRTAANPAEALARLWVRKEAYSKCLGQGMFLDWKSVHLGLKESVVEYGGVSVFTFSTPEGAVGAVAVKCEHPTPSYFNVAANRLSELLPDQ